MRFWDVPYADSQLAAGWRHLRRRPVSNRNHVWFMCSDADKKGLCFPHWMPAELFGTHSLLLLLSGFSPLGDILWRLVWLAAEKCHGRVRSKSAQRGCIQQHLTLLKKRSPESLWHATRMGFLVYWHLELCLWGSSYSFIPEVHLLNSGIHPM